MGRADIGANNLWCSDGTQSMKIALLVLIWTDKSITVKFLSLHFYIPLLSLK